MNINQILVKMYVCCYDNCDILTIERYGIGCRGSNYIDFFSEILSDNYVVLMEMRIRDFKTLTGNDYEYK